MEPLFSQNSHFVQILGNFWIKSGILPQCAFRASEASLAKTPPRFARMTYKRCALVELIFCVLKKWVKNQNYFR